MNTFETEFNYDEVLKVRWPKPRPDDPIEPIELDQTIDFAYQHLGTDILSTIKEEGMSALKA